MILRKFYLHNFRGYQDFTIDFDKDLNVIIGQNDIGKSTIFEALDIFFGEETVKIDIDDLNVRCGEDQEIIIGVSFEIDLSREYTIDSIPTSLAKEYLLNKEGQLEIINKWDCTKGKLTKSSLKRYINAYYPKELANEPLPCLKNSALKKYYEDSYEDKVVEYGIQAPRKNTNSSIRQAIYSVLDKQNQLEQEETELLINKLEDKEVFENIEKDFPYFYLFQSDRANKDTDKEIQDPLKAITKSAVDDVRDQLDEIKQEIETRAKEIGQETIKKLEDLNKDLASELTPEIVHRPWESLFSFSFKSDHNIPMNKRGSGVRRLICLSYFRAEAERTRKSNRNIIYAIEEPETSQHPNHQEILIESLIEISQKNDCQMLITTHAPEVAKQCKDENLILLERKDGRVSISNSEFKLERIAKTLGYKIPFNKLVVCVEGKNDKQFLMNINQCIPEFKDIIDLKSKDISIIPLAGGGLDVWAREHYLKEANITEFHLYDSDNNDHYQSVINQIEKRKDKSKAMQTKLREMENYVSPSIYEEAYQIKFTSEEEKDWGELEVPKLVFSRTANCKNENALKKDINNRLSREVTVESLNDINAFEEVKSWFTCMKKLYEV